MGVVFCCADIQVPCNLCNCCLGFTGRCDILCKGKCIGGLSNLGEEKKREDMR